MKRRGQAAMEFLMTYGWAILAAIIVIGVIAFYILPNLGSGGSSNFQQPFYVAPEEVYVTTGMVKFWLSYNGNGVANIQTINVTSGAYTCINDTTPSLVFKSGEKKEISIGGTNCGIKIGESFKGKTTIYYNISNGYPQIGTGTLAGQAR